VGLGRPDLARALAELERIGLLLQHDSVLPSFTGVVTGESIRGSWWSHPLANPIYDLLQEFRRESGNLSLKLVNGKLTFVAKRLWPALAAVGKGAAAWQQDGLSKDAETLLAFVRKRGAVRADQVDFVPDTDLPKRFAELEKRLLVHVESFHSDAGSHHKLFRSWPRYWRDVGFAPAKRALPAAQGELESATAELCRASHARVRLPW
jgi:hypothetical protein